MLCIAPPLVLNGVYHHPLQVTRPVFNKEVEEQKAAAAHLALTQAAVGMPIRGE